MWISAIYKPFRHTYILPLTYVLGSMIILTCHTKEQSRELSDIHIVISRDIEIISIPGLSKDLEYFVSIDLSE